MKSWPPIHSSPMLPAPVSLRPKSPIVIPPEPRSPPSIPGIWIPGEVVFDPFGGIMTVPFRAVKLGRIGYGCELSTTYWRDGVEYLQRAENEMLAPTLGMFAGLDMDE